MEDHMTHFRAHVRRRALALPAVVVACSVNRPISPTPEPAAVANYLAAHHHPDLLVTDSVGHSRWLHNARLDGDTLRGLRSEEHTSELQSRLHLVCRLLLEKKKLQHKRYE